MVDNNAGDTIASNNSDDGQLQPGPTFVNGSGLLNTPADFKLNAGSYAINTGFAVPVFSDFFRLSRPNGAYDLGAKEF